MKRMQIITAVVYSLMLMALTSCGGAGGATTSLDVTMTDFQFQPSQYTVPAGQEITLNTANNGAVVHNFVIMKRGTSAHAYRESPERARGTAHQAGIITNCVAIFHLGSATFVFEWTFTQDRGGV